MSSGGHARGTPCYRRERLAAILGTNQSHVSNVERGERGLTIQQLLKVCRALKISPEEILGKGEAAEERTLRDRRLLRRLRQIEQHARASGGSGRTGR